MLPSVSEEKKTRQTMRISFHILKVSSWVWRRREEGERLAG